MVLMVKVNTIMVMIMIKVKQMMVVTATFVENIYNLI
jgi:hypothetical protein